MSCKVLSVKEDFEEWRELVQEFNNKDIYFTPGYSKVFQDYGEGEARLFVHESNLGVVAYPFFLKDLYKLEDPIVDKPRQYFDVISPYGYGGPLLKLEQEGARTQLISNFRQNFREFCEESSVVTEFTRFHPLLANQDSYKKDLELNSVAEIDYLQDTVMIDLTRSIQKIWEGYTSRNRNSVRRGGKNKIKLDFYSGEEALSVLDTFRDLYLGTMEYRNASDYYLFPRSFFQNTINYLGSDVEIAIARYQGNVAAGSMFLLKNNFVHYHLSGTDPEYYEYAPNNFMLHRAALRYKKMGFKYFHLGGGHSGNDSLFKFKKSFTKREKDINPFYVGKFVHDKDQYERLKEVWSENNAENLNTKGMTVDEISYFPVYRYSFDENGDD